MPKQWEGTGRMKEWRQDPYSSEKNNQIYLFKVTGSHWGAKLKSIICPRRSGCRGDGSYSALGLVLRGRGSEDKWGYFQTSCMLPLAYPVGRRQKRHWDAHSLPPACPLPKGVSYPHPGSWEHSRKWNLTLAFPSRPLAKENSPDSSMSRQKAPSRDLRTDNNRGKGSGTGREETSPWHYRCMYRILSVTLFVITMIIITLKGR